ncbi:MAG: DUF6433 family protein [Nitrosarchaeum sp.]|nr:DUF6433 family protein [Nitrosarchaeum sp.]
MTITTVTKKVTIPKTKEVLLDLPSNPFVFEVFDLVNKMRTEQKKVEVLQKYEHPSLKALFIWNFDESVITILPPGQVPYSNLKSEQRFRGTLSDKVDNLIGTMNYNQTTSLGNASDLTEGHTTIRKEFKRFYNFIKGGNDSLPALRKETMFIQMLEGLHPLEAEIICLVKDKNLQSKYKITKEIVSKTYPDIVWGGRS